MKLSEAREEKHIAFEKLCREMARIEVMKKMELNNKIQSELERLNLMLDNRCYIMAEVSIKRLIKLNEELHSLK